MNPFLHNFRIYLDDTDAGGVVYHAQYLKFFEQCRTEFCRAKGIVKNDCYQFVVFQAHITYMKPLYLDDIISVTAQITKATKARLVFHQRILRDETAIATAAITLACVDKTFKVVRIPDILLEKLL